MTEDEVRAALAQIVADADAGPGDKRAHAVPIHVDRRIADAVLAALRADPALASAAIRLDTSRRDAVR